MNNKASFQYIETINDDLSMEDEDAASNITFTTQTSQLSQNAREERRRAIYLDLQKSKLSEKYEEEQAQLEAEEVKIRLTMKQVERKENKDSLEAELSILSQTPDQLAELDDEEIEYFGPAVNIGASSL